MTVEAEPLLVRRTPEAVEVVSNRPHRHNAFTNETYDGLLHLCASLRDVDSVRVVVFRGAGGRAFAAGNEISEFTSLTEGSDGVAYEARVGRVLRGIADLPQVTVAAVEGIRLASRNTLVATKEQLLRRTDTLEVSPADDVERLERAYGASDFAEGVRAFLAEEKPDFR